MAFIWTTPINIGDEILDLAIKELRTNCDTLDDSPSCLTYYGTVFVSEYTTYETTFYTDNRNSERQSNYTMDYSPYCTGQTGGECIVY